MPTRADYYVGDGPGAIWLGSCGFDGFPAALDKSILNATTESDYQSAVKTHLVERSDGILPEEGWPWPWKDSFHTEYAYTWVNDSLWGWGTTRWFRIDRYSPTFGEEPDGSRMPIYGSVPSFPDMSSRMRPRGARKGTNNFNTTRTLLASIPEQKTRE